MGKVSKDVLECWYAFRFVWSWYCEKRNQVSQVGVKDMAWYWKYFMTRLNVSLQGQMQWAKTLWGVGREAEMWRQAGGLSVAYESFRLRTATESLWQERTIRGRNLNRTETMRRFLCLFRFKPNEMLVNGKLRLLLSLKVLYLSTEMVSLSWNGTRIFQMKSLCFWM